MRQMMTDSNARLMSSHRSSTDTLRLVVLASGHGTNAEHLVRHFNAQDQKVARVVALLSNRKEAPVLEKMRQAGVPTKVFANEDFEKGSERLLSYLYDHADALVLAGFLRRLARSIVVAFDSRIVNIHPALLTEHSQYGGRGMYGFRVHEAVLRDGQKESGITIHVVDEEYDKGKIIHSVPCEVAPGDSPDTLARRVQQLEHKHYPAVVARWCEGWAS